MRVRAVKPFIDLKAGKHRAAGDVFDVTKARFAEINEKGFGVLVEEVAKRDEG